METVEAMDGGCGGEGAQRPGRWSRSCRGAAADAANGRRSALSLSKPLLLLAVCWAVLPLARAGTFISGSVRWEMVEANKARFDVVTYWRRSFSPFKDGKAMPGA